MAARRMVDHHRKIDRRHSVYCWRERIVPPKSVQWRGTSRLAERVNTTPNQLKCVIVIRFQGCYTREMIFTAGTIRINNW